MSDREKRYGVHHFGRRYESAPTTAAEPGPFTLAARLTRIADVHEERPTNGDALLSYGTGGIERPVEQMTLTPDDLRLIADFLRKHGEI